MRTAIRLNRGARLLLLVILTAMLMACESPARPGPDGYIYFGSGSYLGKFGLHDGASQVVAYVGELSVTGVGAYRDGDLLLTVHRLVNSQDTVMVGRFDIATRHFTSLFAGSSAVFLPQGQITVYDDGSSVRAAWIANNERKLKKVYSHAIDEKVIIKAISDQDILFQVAKDDVSRIFRYDTGSKTLAPLAQLSNACDLDGAVWVAERAQMLCHLPGKSRADRSYRFVSLDGLVGAGFAAPGDNPFRPIAYLPDQHLLVLTETWHGLFGGRQKYAVWIHDLASGERYRLVKDQYLGDHVVYTSR